MTEAMRRAVQWLKERGGSGVIDRHGRVLAAGEVASHIAAETWLRLVGESLVSGSLGRIQITGEIKKW